MSVQDESLRSRQLVKGAQLGDAITAHLDSLRRLQAQVSYMTQAAALVERHLGGIEADLDQVRALLAARGEALDDALCGKVPLLRQEGSSLAV